MKAEVEELYCVGSGDGDVVKKKKRKRGSRLPFLENHYI